MLYNSEEDELDDSEDILYNSDDELLEDDSDDSLKVSLLELLDDSEDSLKTSPPLDSLELDEHSSPVKVKNPLVFC